MSAAITTLVEAEIRRGDAFDNTHGITAANIREFLVEPFTVSVDPDDLETAPRSMWVVLQERHRSGYVVVHDPATSGWAVAERIHDGTYRAVVWGRTLANALEGM